jgi:hypothetical protein
MFASAARVILKLLQHTVSKLNFCCTFSMVRARTYFFSSTLINFGSRLFYAQLVRGDSAAAYPHQLQRMHAMAFNKQQKVITPK